MLALFLAALGGTTQDSPGAAPQFPATLVPREWLAIEALDARGRRPFRPDAVFAKHLLARDAAPPSEGDALTGEFGKEQRWRKVEADAKGAIPGNFGYAYTAIDSPETVVVMAKLSGAVALYVNGTGFTGDAYGYGFGGVPIVLSKGVNHVYVSGARGTASLVLERPASTGVLATWDFTLPHVPRELGVERASALVFNASDRAAEYTLHYATAGEISGIEFRHTGTIPALGLAMVEHDLGAAGAVAADAKDVALHYELRNAAGVVTRATLTAPLLVPDGPKLVSYRSRVDGSVQTAAVRGSGRPVLTLHGASVDAWGQLMSYSDHAGFQIIAPRNRRPYGFDWQDWGRIDAYEALDAARATLEFETEAERKAPIEHHPARVVHPPDERVFVTGHSMGGHGTWHFAANDPDRVLAIAPSAGWCSFDTYGSRPQGELRELWRAADGASRTEDLVANLLGIPTYVLHGDADDNVPASEGRAMIERLEKLGAHPRSHFQPAAGHWWDGDAAAGADCVDWPAIFELFAATEAPTRSPDELHWVSIDPGVDAVHHWLRVEQPLVYGKPFEVHATRTGERIEVRTVNVRVLGIGELAGIRVLALDAAQLALADGTRGALYERFDDAWVPHAGLWPNEKRPAYSGPFKRAFDQDFVLVPGEAKFDRERDELFERARADQQQWWYRANGAPSISSDGRVRERRNVILYGNADTNRAWKTVVPRDFPIRVHRGRIEVEDRRYDGDNLACVFVAPRADDREQRSLVGGFGATGVPGIRLGYTLQPFTSGVGYPDYVIFSTDVLTKGDGGVLEAGWFDRDWKVQREGAFRRAPPK